MVHFKEQISCPYLKYSNELEETAGVQDHGKKNVVFVAEQKLFKSWLCHLLAVWSWISYLTWLSLSFLICKTEIN